MAAIAPLITASPACGEDAASCRSTASEASTSAPTTPRGLAGSTLPAGFSALCNDGRAREWSNLHTRLYRRLTTVSAASRMPI